MPKKTGIHKMTSKKEMEEKMGKEARRLIKSFEKYGDLLMEEDMELFKELAKH